MYIRLRKGNIESKVINEEQAALFIRNGYERITPEPPTVKEKMEYRPLEELTDKELRSICEDKEPTVPWRNLSRRDYIECIKGFGWY